MLVSSIWQKDNEKLLERSTQNWHFGVIFLFQQMLNEMKWITEKQKIGSLFLSVPWVVCTMSLSSHSELRWSAVSSNKLPHFLFFLFFFTSTILFVLLHAFQDTTNYPGWGGGTLLFMNFSGTAGFYFHLCNSSEKEKLSIFQLSISLST